MELTEEERRQWFAPKSGFDVKDAALSVAFVDCSIPEKAEGFDAVRFEWQGEGPAKAYLRKKVLERKRTTKVEALQPSPWFQEKWGDFKKLFAEWQKKQDAFKSSPAQKAKAAETVAKKVASQEEEEDAAVVDDIFSVEDVCNVGEGEPLFKDFELADWSLCQLRFELWLLQVSFQKDVNDPDRPAIPQAHLGFYHQKYFKRVLNPKHFGAEDVVELARMVREYVGLGGGAVDHSLAGGHRPRPLLEAHGGGAPRAAAPH